MEGNLRFKIDWASLIVGWKFTVFALFCYVFEGNFQVQAPRGLIYISRGDLTKGFFALRVCGAYIWRGLYMEGHILEILRDITSRMKDQQLQHVSSRVYRSPGVPIPVNSTFNYTTI